MEFIFGFITGYLLTWPAFGILCILAIFAEYTSANKMAAFFGLASLGIAYFLLAIPLKTLAIGSVVYLSIGVAWSFWRYKRFVSAGVKEIQNRHNKNLRESSLKTLQISNNIGAVTSWILAWPFSLIENLIGDFIELLHTAITKWFRGLYDSIFNAAARDLLEEIEQEKVNKND